MTETIYSTVTGKFTEWGSSFIEMLPNIALAIIVFLLFYFLSRGLKNLSYKLLNKFNDHLALNRLISTVFALVIFTAGLFFALDIIGLDKTVTSLLAGAGIAGLALSFAFQELASNFIAGVMIALRKPFKVGDIVDSDGIYGTVRELNLRATVIATPQGQMVIVPNKQIFQSPLHNFSKTNARRIDLVVGISYGENLEKVQEVTTKAVENVKHRQADKDVQFYFEEFGDSSINFVVMFWIDFFEPIDYFQPVSDAIMNIKKAYNENDITIPFPIRTLDFGIKGGEKLSEMLENGKSAQLNVKK